MTVGGQLQQFSCAWQMLSTPEDILSIIQSGYRIPFTHQPPTVPPPLHDPQLAADEMTALDSEVCDLLMKGSIEETDQPGFMSHLFCIPKKTRDLRPVLNLRPLNAYIAPHPFKMETLESVCHLINKGDYLTSLDLQDAFHHVLIHPHSQCYLQFRWKGKQYQFKVLPFRLSLAPLIFTKVLRPLLQWAHKQGIRISAYLDDLLIVAASKEQSRKDTIRVQEKLTQLGFLIKMSKSQTTPTQRIDHLGYTIDTISMTLEVPGNKIRDIRWEANRMAQKGVATLCQLSSFIGKATVMLGAVFPARLQT